MTLREAAEIAMRECGVPEDQIQKRVGYANSFAPVGADTTLPEGSERRVIDQMKEIETLRKLDPNIQDAINQVAMDFAKHLENN